MVATDTHRMAVKKITIDEPATTPMRAIIPTKTLAEVSRLLQQISSDDQHHLESHTNRV